MRFLLAVLIPGLKFFLLGRPIAGVICLFLQLTFIGWVIAAIWAVSAVKAHEGDQAIERKIDEAYRKTGRRIQ